MSDAQFTTESFVLHQWYSIPICRRVKDGYIDATAMCKAAKKDLHSYRRSKSTKKFLAALESDTGIPITELIQSVVGGSPKLQGTWVHLSVAVHLAQWCTPKSAVDISFGE